MDDDIIYILKVEPKREIEREVAEAIHRQLPDEDADVISLLSDDGTLRISYKR